MPVTINETSLPGVGRRYDFTTECGDGEVVVVVQSNGACELSLEPSDRGVAATVRLTNAEAVALAAVLTGAEITLRRDEPDADETAQPGDPSP